MARDDRCDRRNLYASECEGGYGSRHAVRRETSCRPVRCPKTKKSESRPESRTPESPAEPDTPDEKTSVGPEPQPAQPVAGVPEGAQSDPVCSSYRWAVKTNVAYLAATVANIGIEYGFGKHCSVDLPIIYSPYTVARDYRLRFLAVQPEFRYWLKEPMKGHFFGAHLNIGAFNIAVDDKNRYQSPDGFYGAGLSYGYVLPFARHWAAEFTIGAGYVHTKYDTYYNIPNGTRFEKGIAYNYWGLTKWESVWFTDSENKGGAEDEKTDNIYRLFARPRIDRLRQDRTGISGKRRRGSHAGQYEPDPGDRPENRTLRADGRSEAPEADTHDVRWIVEVFRDEIGGEPVEQQVLSCEQAADGHHVIRTSLAVHAARYHVVAWMDYVDDGSTADKYYHVNSLSSISVPEAGDYIGNEDHKDAYIAQQEIDLKDYRDRWNATADATVTLQRPMAKIEFITTDIDKFLDELAARRAKAGTIAENLLVKNPDLSTIRVQVEYAGYFPSGFNAYTNKPNDAPNGHVIRMQHDAVDGQGGAPGQRLHLRQWLRIGREGRSYHPRQRGQPAEPYRGASTCRSYGAS